MNCIKCKSQSIDRARRGQGSALRIGDLHRCRDCGAMFSDAMPGLETLAPRRRFNELIGAFKRAGIVAKAAAAATTELRENLDRLRERDGQLARRLAFQRLERKAYVHLQSGGLVRPGQTVYADNDGGPEAFVPGVTGTNSSSNDGIIHDVHVTFT